MNALMKLAAKGYGWYLALKIGKAILAVPCFVAWISVVTVLGLLAYAWDAITGFAKEMTDCIRDFWSRPWFRGFSRGYYKSLEHYHTPPPIPLNEVGRRPAA